MKKIFFAAVAFLISCSSAPPKINSKAVSPDFSYNSAKFKKFYITPVINNTKTGIKKSTDVMEFIFQQELKDYIFINHERTLEQFDSILLLKHYKYIADDYKKNGTIDGEKIKKFGESLKDGYIVFCRIDHFNIENYKKEGYVPVYNENKTYSRVIEKTYGSKSSIGGIFSIYSIESGKEIFRAEHDDYDITINSEIEKTEHESISQSLFSGCISAPVANLNEKNKYPKPYGTVHMSASFFQVIAKNIPYKKQ